jgi:hypothetical protein
LREIDDYIKRLTESKLPEIKDGVKVHSVLRTEDLRLIRKGFLALIRSDEIGKMVDGKVRDGERACELLKRILRKVK